jgi:hypothetical protein
MAGLLDFLNTDEGRLGLGLLGAAAPTMQPMNFAGRLAQGMDNYQGMQQQQQKSKFIDMQMQNYQSEIDARKLAEQKFAQQQAIDAQWLGSGTTQPISASPSAGVQSAPGIPGSPSPSADGKIGELSRQYGVPKEALWADYRFNGGKKIAEMISDRSKPNWMNVNGNLVNTNDQGFQGGIQGGISAGKDGQVTAWQPDGHGGLVVGAPAGSLDTFKAYEDVKSGLKPIKVYNPATGREEYTNERAVVGQQGGNGFPSGYAGGSRETADAGRLAILQSEMQNPSLAPADRAALQREIDRMQPQSRASGTQAAPASGSFAAGPSIREKLSGDAGGKINETWLKTSYEPVIAGITGTDDLLSSVRVARNAMDKMGGTGWGTEAKAIGANVLSGLGLSSGNSKMLASNAQVFQNAAMERLQSTLNLAKGPQTEGDADRASKTFAQLKNMTEANSFILDLAEARAQREKMKASFYQQALPVAQQKGDLQEIDREWAKRTPSIFSLPSMTKWGVK